MSRSYYAFIQQEVRGPFSVAQLQAMEKEGEVFGATSIKGETDSMWGSWMEIRPADAVVEQVAQSLNIVSESTKPSPAKVLQELRRNTIYPLTRTWLYFPFGLAATVSLIGWVTVLIMAAGDDDAARARLWIFIPLVAGASLCSMGLFLFSAIGHAILDLADGAAADRAKKLQ